MSEAREGAEYHSTRLRHEPVTHEDDLESIEGRMAAHVEKLKHSIGEFIKNPIEKDHRIDAFRQATLWALENGDSQLSAVYEDQYRLKHQMNKSLDATPPIYPTNLALRSFQKVLMEQEALPDGLSYPYDFDNPETWLRGMRHVLDNPKTFSDFSFFFNYMPVQSNIADRGKSLKILLNMYSERFDGPARVMDIGCSQNHVLQVIANNLNFFQPFTTMDLPAGFSKRDTQHAVKKLRKMLLGEVEIGPSLGVDMAFVPGDANVQAWVKSCSHYPSDLLNDKKMSYYDQLVSANSPKVGFAYEDFSKPSLQDSVQSSRQFDSLPGDGEEDVITFFTVLYECSLQDRQTMLERAMNLVSPNGIVMVQDFARVNPENSSQLDFDPWYQRQIGDRWPYKGFVWDKTAPELGWQPFIDWTNGRCQTMRLQPLALQLLEKTT